MSSEDDDSADDAPGEQLYADDGVDFSWIDDLYHSSDNPVSDKLLFKQRVLAECESIARSFFLLRFSVYSKCYFYDFISQFDDERISSERITSIIDTLLKNVYANSTTGNKKNKEGSTHPLLPPPEGSRSKVAFINIDDMKTLKAEHNCMSLRSFLANWNKRNRDGYYPHLNAKVRAALLLRFGDNYVDSILTSVIRRNALKGQGAIDWRDFDYKNPSYDSSISGRINVALLLHFLVKHDTMAKIFELQYLKSFRLTESSRGKPSKDEVINPILAKIGLVGCGFWALEGIRMRALLCEGVISVSDVNDYFDHVGNNRRHASRFKNLCTLSTVHSHCKQRLGDDDSNRFINVMFANGLYSIGDFESDVGEVIESRILDKAAAAATDDDCPAPVTESLCSKVKRKILDGSGGSSADMFDAVLLRDLLTADSGVSSQTPPHQQLGDLLLLYVLGTMARRNGTFAHSDGVVAMVVAVADLEAFCFPYGLAVRCRYYPEIALPAFKLSLSPFDSADSLHRQVVNQTFASLRRVAISAKSGFKGDPDILNVKVPTDIAIFADIQLKRPIKKSGKIAVSGCIGNGQKVYVASQYVLSFSRALGVSARRAVATSRADKVDADSDGERQPPAADEPAGRPDVGFLDDKPVRRRKGRDRDAEEEDPAARLQELGGAIRRDIAKATRGDGAGAAERRFEAVKRPFPGALTQAHYWSTKLLLKYLVDQLELAELAYVFKYLDWSGSEFLLISESFVDRGDSSGDSSGGSDSDDGNSISSDVSNNSKTNSVAYFYDNYRNETIAEFFAVLSRESKDLKNINEIIVFKIISSSKKLLQLNLRTAVDSAPFSFADYDEMHVSAWLWRKHKVNYLLYIVLRKRMTGRYFLELQKKSSEIRLRGLFEESSDDSSGNIAMKFETSLKDVLVQLAHARLSAVHKGSRQLLAVYTKEVRVTVAAVAAAVAAAARPTNS